MPRSRCWVSGRVLAPGHRGGARRDPRHGNSPTRCRGGGPCLVLTWLLYFERVFAQCQTRLLCLLLIFVFSNDVCFAPPALLPVPGVSLWAPTAALPCRGDGAPTSAPSTPAPSRGAATSRRQGRSCSRNSGFLKSGNTLFFPAYPPPSKQAWPWMLKAGKGITPRGLFLIPCHPFWWWNRKNTEQRKGNQKGWGMPLGDINSAVG